jgi:flagellar basal-body rod protein FlgF
MTDTIQNISLSLRADIATLNTISNNVANTATPGFRAGRSIPTFESQLGGVTPPVAVDLSDGSLQLTGGPLDLALRGHGFFQVEHNGQTLLTRAGNFRMDTNGNLVNANGDTVVGGSGALTLTDNKVRIDATGEIWSGQHSLGQLKIVDVASPEKLTVADGGFSYDGELSTWKGSVQQGAIEHGNVDVAGETIRLIELTRHVESLQHAMSIYDKAMDTGINHIGE